MENCTPRVELTGRLKVRRYRCFVELESGEKVLLKCPGLGIALLRTCVAQSGPFMVDAPCEIRGRFLSEKVDEFERVFGDLDHVVAYSCMNTKVEIDMATVQELDARQLENCRYAELHGDFEFRKELLRIRQIW